jgi:hypothetical protein
VTPHDIGALQNFTVFCNQVVVIPQPCSHNDWRIFTGISSGGCILALPSTVENGRGEMTVWKLKSCPKCGGDLHIDRDLENWFACCLQCGHERLLNDPATPVETMPEVAVEEEPMPFVF